MKRRTFSFLTRKTAPQPEFAASDAILDTIARRHRRIFTEIRNSDSQNAFGLTGTRCCGKTYLSQASAIAHVVDHQGQNAAVLVGNETYKRQFLKNWYKTLTTLKPNLGISLSTQTSILSVGNSKVYCFAPKSDHNLNHPLANPSLLSELGVTLCTVDDIHPEDDETVSQLNRLMHVARLSCCKIIACWDSPLVQRTMLDALVMAYWNIRVYEMRYTDLADVLPPGNIKRIATYVRNFS